jgi:hypothetical protein
MNPRTTNHRRGEQTNFGNAVMIAGGAAKSQSIAWVTADQSDSYTIYARATHKQGALATPVLVVEWGHGGASIDRAFPLHRPLTLPLAASMVKLSGRLVGEGGGPAPEDARYEIAAFIARGHADVPERTASVVQTGAMGLLGAGPQRLERLTGFRAAPWFSVRWVMLFDAASVRDVPDGTEPVLARPLPLYPRCFDLGAREFGRGIVWAVSEHPLRLALDRGAIVRMEAELAA